MNHITIELCTEDRARLDRIANLLEQTLTKPTTAAPAKADEEKKAEPEELPAENKKPAEAATAPPTVSTVTAEDIRAKFLQLAATDKKEQARMLIKLYADKISTIPEDKLAEVLEKLNELEG